MIFCYLHIFKNNGVQLFHFLWGVFLNSPPNLLNSAYTVLYTLSHTCINITTALGLYLVKIVVTTVKAFSVHNSQVCKSHIVCYNIYIYTITSKLVYLLLILQLLAAKVSLSIAQQFFVIRSSFTEELRSKTKRQNTVTHCG